MNDSFPLPIHPAGTGSHVFTTDPFVDPALLAPSPINGALGSPVEMPANLSPTSTPMATNLESLTPSPQGQQQNEPAVVYPTSASQPLTKPEVEIIAATPSPTRDACDVQLNISVVHASQQHTIPSTTALDAPAGSHNPPVPELPSISQDYQGTSVDTDGLAIHEFDLALNVLPNRIDNQAEQQRPCSSAQSKPPLQIDSKSDEPVFDVRDFAGEDLQPLPIAGSYDLAPDTFDHFTAEEIDAILAASDKSITSANSPSPHESEDLSEDSLFLAENDQVIQIDGNDGFGTIDLRCFDVAVAEFKPGSINIDDPATGSRFEVRYQNVGAALFANGSQIDLSRWNG